MVNPGLIRQYVNPPSQDLTKFMISEVIAKFAIPKFQLFIFCTVPFEKNNH